MNWWQAQLSHCQELERFCNALVGHLEPEGCFTLGSLAVLGLGMRNVSQCPASVNLISAATCSETPV